MAWAAVVATSMQLRTPERCGNCCCCCGFAACVMPLRSMVLLASMLSPVLRVLRPMLMPAAAMLPLAPLLMPLPEVPAKVAALPLPLLLPLAMTGVQEVEDAAPHQPLAA